MSDNKTPVIYRNLTYLADVYGTGFWRHIQQITTANCIQNETRIFNTYTQEPICDPRYYTEMNSVTIQRWLTDGQRDFVEKFLYPVTRQEGIWLIYEIDDAMGKNDIPLYNRGRKAFYNDNIQNNIKFMLDKSDIVIVTTDYIKEYYARTYDIPMRKIVAVPNLLPHWWYGDKYQPNIKIQQFKENKSRPRIGIVSSLSHYNIDNVKDETGQIAKDDFDEIADVIRETVDDLQWVIFGYEPPQLKDEIEKRKVECHGCVPILQYPSSLYNLGLQAIIAPLQDNEFNRCKSNIKYIESCAIGVPLFASNCIPYKGTLPENQLFSSQDDLKNKLLKLKFSSIGEYRKMIEQQWTWLNSPIQSGDFNLRNWWLEDNMRIWFKLFRLENMKDKNPQQSNNTEENNNESDRVH